MLILALVFLMASQVNAHTGIVYTVRGAFRGVVTSDNYHAFYGIPYGEPITAETRFKAPTPAPRRPIIEDVFEANITTVLCPQPSPHGPIGVEDCLRLNIFTNGTDSNYNTAKPVLVWLMGEEYTTSNPLLRSFRNLIAENLLVVTVNYRLSVFGFLCLGIEDAPGNAGLKDVVEALKWIRENIRFFGGDANNVALIGHGSGAAMVDLISMSPLAENLFHKVMVHSGSALSPWAVAFNPVGNAEAYARHIGFNGTARQELVEFLRTIPANILVNNLNAFEFRDNTYLFAPCIENNELNPSDTFLHDAPINLLRSGNYSHVSFVTTYTDKEGSLRLDQAVNGDWMQQMQINFTNFLPVDVIKDVEAEQIIRNFYFAENNFNQISLQEYLNYHGDTMIRVPVIRGAIERAVTSRADVRVLEFSYQGTNNTDWPFPGINITGVPHGGLLNFILDFDLIGDGDVHVSRSIVDRYVAFGYTGIPYESGMVSWPSFQFARAYVSYSGGYIGPGLWHFRESRQQQPSPMEMILWEDIYSKYYIAPTPVSSAGRIAGVTLIILFNLIIGIVS